MFISLTRYFYMRTYVRLETITVYCLARYLRELNSLSTVIL
jgi:hypothetical protein